MLALTIIVPTVPSRTSPLSRLLCGLGEQTDPRCEVLVVDGPGLLGDKINAGVRAARGRLSVVVDDDDQVAADYIPTVCDEITAHRHVEPPEFVGYRLAYTMEGRFAASIEHHRDGDPTWQSDRRGITPKCPFDTLKARTVEFGNEYTADRVWSQMMTPLLKRHAFIDRHLYHYDFSEGASLFVGDGRRDVGAWPFHRSRFRWMSDEIAAPVEPVVVLDGDGNTHQGGS